MAFHVQLHDRPPLDVDADDHRVEGGWHVFRRDTLVMGRPRSVVTLRLPAGDVRSVGPCGPIVEQGGSPP